MCSGGRVPKTPFEVRRRCGYRQVQVLAMIRACIDERGEQPSYKQIMDELGIDGKGNVSRTVHSLVRRGEIEIDRIEGRPIIRRANDNP